MAIFFGHFNFPIFGKSRFVPVALRFYFTSFREATHGYSRGPRRSLRNRLPGLLGPRQCCIYLVFHFLENTIGKKLAPSKTAPEPPFPILLKFLTENCGFLDKLLPGDVVMADRGFTVNESVGLKQAKLIIPAFTKGRSQLDPVDVEKTRGIASVRIHVERVIGLLHRKYTILEGTFPQTFLGVTLMDHLKHRFQS